MSSTCMSAGRLTVTVLVQATLAFQHTNMHFPGTLGSGELPPCSDHFWDLSGQHYSLNTQILYLWVNWLLVMSPSITTTGTILSSSLPKLLCALQKWRRQRKTWAPLRWELTPRGRRGKLTCSAFTDRILKALSHQSQPSALLPAGTPCLWLWRYSLSTSNTQHLYRAFHLQSTSRTSFN